MQVYKDELYHHGIKGMKWGVRRYQNYDGTYTQAGLKRYHQAEANYDKAKSQYENAQASGDRMAVKKARTNLHQTKRTLNSTYDALKFDKRADQGKQYYARGERITDNQAKAATQRQLLGMGGSAASYVLSKNGYKKAAIVTSTMTAAVGVGQGVYMKYKNDRLRAYYAHSGKKLDKENHANAKTVNTVAKAATTKKVHSAADYERAQNRATEKLNDSSSNILSDFNKKWEGKYDTQAYNEAFMQLYNKLVDDELK